MMSKKHLPVRKQIAVELLIMAAIGLVLGFLGPFGTYAMPVGMRLLYWVGFIIVGYAIFRPVSITAEWLRASTGIPEWAAVLLSAAIAALPLSVLIGFAIAGMRFDPRFFGNAFLVLYLQCAATGCGIYLLMRLVFGRDHAHATTPATEDATTPPPSGLANTSEDLAIQARIQDRLPPGFPPEILALGVEDHYVRVHAPGRSEMLLMRLSDAIVEMEPLDGMQVHRSWWVARSAVMTSKRDGRNWLLVLHNDLQVPVSRTYVAKLKQSGWI